VNHPGFFHQGGKVAIVEEQTPVAVIVKRGIHPEDGTVIFSCCHSFLEEKKGFLGAFLRILSHPDEERHLTANNHETLVQEIFPLRRAEVDSLTCIGTGDEHGVNMR
jgi:hypothetical protein